MLYDFDFERNEDQYGTFTFMIKAQSRNLELRTETYTQAKRWVRALTWQLKLWTGRTGQFFLQIRKLGLVTSHVLIGVNSMCIFKYDQPKLFVTHIRWTAKISNCLYVHIINPYK